MKKKGIEVQFDSSRNLCRYKVTKKKGKFTLDELVSTAKEIGTFDGFAVMVLDLRDNEDPVPEGDYVELFDYRDVWRKQ